MKSSKKQVHSLVCQAIKQDLIFVAQHAIDRSQQRGILVDDILYSVLTGGLVEESFNGRYIIRGRTKNSIRVESIWTYNEQSGTAVLITAYKTDANSWINSHKRK